ncbi:YczE/YyaS/YitT family protein [Desertibacillus haloalkaliphilus]|uniref:YczE/YyaS/YitT family protein n=1 Tax=Desertibacillus haloalkaliphilus TaxID=1328930 RepID=UPI001C25EBBA|nr:BCR, YitT family protein [Desertibacillus haloalkaliphilus]MBU8906198.1 BCR, YitT family protein [Desertibacillus haloalkaliphilus]
MGKRIGIYLAGLAIAALGIALVILSLLGAGPWDTVAIGLNGYLVLTIGTWSIIIQLLFTLLTWLIEKTRIRIESIIPIVIRSWFLDIWIYLVFRNADFSSSWEAQWLCLLGGIIIIGIGISIYLEAQFPRLPIDGLMIAICHRFNCNFNISRLSIEATGAILGLLLGGPVGIGTLVTALLLGKVIQVFHPMIKKLLHIQVKTVETRT